MKAEVVHDRQELSVVVVLTGISHAALGRPIVDQTTVFNGRRGPL